MTTKEPTLAEVIEALDEIEDALDTATDSAMLYKLSELYALAYSFKLHMMAKETCNARR